MKHKRWMNPMYWHFSLPVRKTFKGIIIPYPKAIEVTLNLTLPPLERTQGSLKFLGSVWYEWKLFMYFNKIINIFNPVELITTIVASNLFINEIWVKHLYPADSSESKFHKTVLLRERKRHTDRGVSSTPSVTRGGVPPSWTWLGYPPLPAGLAGVPPSPAGVNWWTKWNYNLPFRTTYAVGKNTRGLLKGRSGMHF